MAGHMKALSLPRHIQKRKGCRCPQKFEFVLINQAELAGQVNTQIAPARHFTIAGSPAWKNSQCRSRFRSRSFGQIAFFPSFRKLAIGDCRNLRLSDAYHPRASPWPRKFSQIRRGRPISLRVRLSPPLTFMALTRGAAAVRGRDPRTISARHPQVPCRTGVFWFVHAIFSHGFSPGKGAGKGAAANRLSNTFFKRRIMPSVFRPCADVSSFTKPHFNIELGKFGLAVGAQIRIAKRAQLVITCSKPATISICLKSCGDWGRA